MLSAHSCRAFQAMVPTEAPRLERMGVFLALLNHSPNPLNPTLTRVHLIPPLQMEIRTFNL